MLLASARTNASSKLYIDDLFSAYLRTGTGADVTTTTGIDMTKGYMLWSKGRSGATDHAIYDSARGVTKDLVSNSTAAETTQATGLKAVSTTGHTIGSLAKMNTSSATYVDFVFRNAPKFFDVVTFTVSTPTTTINHSLGVTPGMVIFKRTDNISQWYVWHRSLTSTNYFLAVNQTYAQQNTGVSWITASSTQVSATTAVLDNGGTYVAYLFAHDTDPDGMIQCGSYSGNGGLNSINVGWEPQFLLIKSATSSESWYMFDTMRGLSYGKDARLYSDLSSAEDTSTDNLHPTATGFTIINAPGGLNQAGNTYIYLAIRRPNKPPTSGTQVYNAIARTGTGAAATVTGVGFAPDIILSLPRDAGYQKVIVDRLRGPSLVMRTSFYGIERSTSDAMLSIDMNGYTCGTDATYTCFNGSGISYINYFFKRVPGFFNTFCYTGTGANKTEAHGLEAMPEIWLVGSRSTNTNWALGSSLIANTQKIAMPTANGVVTDASVWNSTYPTATNISLGTSAEVNSSGVNYVCHVWRTFPGISKVGSYTGNGTSQTINCGFSSGARFVMIIRTTASTEQAIRIWDSVRGIVAENDPYLPLDTTSGEATNDSVDPTNSGFIVNQVAATNINVNGASYIFLSVA